MNSLYIFATEAEKLALQNKIIMNGSLHELSSTNETILINSRSVEYMLCESFNLTNVARKDSPIDAFKNQCGFGIKTFGLLHLNDKTLHKLEKVAEFKYDSLTISQCPSNFDKAVKVSTLRNQRLIVAMRSESLNNLLYILILRLKKEIFFYEHSYELINTNKIIIINSNEKSIKFTDGSNIYSYKYSNSTLYQEFSIEKSKIKEIYIIEKTYSSKELEDKLISKNEISLLFSDILKPASGLNQGHAKGRKRDPDEIYIPIKSTIHKQFPYFFPRNKQDLDMPFTLMLTNKKFVNCKICQSNRKALMSNPNKELGKHILRELLKIPKEQVCTMEHIEKSGYTGLKVIKNNNIYYLELF